MRIVICWPLISGYMAACWRALSAEPEVMLQVLAWRPDTGRDHIGFESGLTAGLNVDLLNPEARSDTAVILERVVAHEPDLVVVPGWFWPPYRAVAKWAHQRSLPVIMTMDTSLRFSLRQLAGRWVQWPYFRRISGVYVPGERAYLLARWLGFREEQVRVGAYGFDFEAFAHCYEVRCARPEGWPRSFLYVGRYLARKGIDTLLEAYALYRTQVPAPWSLICCGQGPLGEALRQVEGVEDRGFVQPADLPGMMIDAGAFVLPSRFEAWGVALAEAGAAGMPLLASRSVGASVEVLRDGYNGRRFDTGDAAGLADAMLWVHARADRLAELGARSRCLAEPFRAELWAERLLALGQDLRARAT